MRYTKIDSKLFIQNRKQLARLTAPNSIIILHANDILPTNADGVLPFYQNKDLFYLSGIDQEDTMLVMFPDFVEEKFREVLFIKETSELIAIWDGSKLTKEEASKASGIETVYWIHEFDKVVKQLFFEAENIYLNTNEHTRASVPILTKERRFVDECKKKYPLHQYHRLAPILSKLRAVKSSIEIDLLQAACNITEQGFRRVLSFVKPGVFEFEIEAEFIHEFVRNRSRGFAYSPIIATGGNACVLHYIDNQDQCQDGDLILFDVGAEYANYNADMTRTIPVNGRYTDRQKAVYNAVLRVMRKAMSLLTPGNNLVDYHEEVGKIMESELIELGLIDRTDVKNQDPKHPLYKKYFMHGTSHHLGLDVHDVGSKYMPFEAGMVFTVEPGIYIREENIGIRLENDVVITSNGVNDLMKTIPIETEEIEELMSGSNS